MLDDFEIPIQITNYPYSIKLDFWNKLSIQKNLARNDKIQKWKEIIKIHLNLRSSQAENYKKELIPSAWNQR